jgi:hypothetical protein
MKKSRYINFSILFFSLCLLGWGIFMLLKPDPMQQDIRDVESAPSPNSPSPNLPSPGQDEPANE